MTTKPIRLTLALGLGDLLVIATVFCLAAGLIFEIGSYNGKWDTIAAYQNGNVSEKPSIFLRDRRVMVQMLTLSVAHSALPEEDDWMIGNKTTLLRKLKKPVNILERIRTDYPDIEIGNFKDLPRVRGLDESDGRDKYESRDWNGNVTASATSE